MNWLLYADYDAAETAIEDLTVSDVIEELLHRMVDEPMYSFIGGAKDYDNLVMTNKPDLSFFNLELAEYAVDLKAEARTYFDRKGWQARFDALKHPRLTLIEELGIANPAKYRDHVRSTLTEAIITALEAKDAEIDSRIAGDASDEQAYDQFMLQLKAIDIPDTGDIPMDTIRAFMKAAVMFIRKGYDGKKKPYES